MSKNLIIVAIFLAAHVTAQLSFSSPSSPADQCYSIQQTTNGYRVSLSEQGWVAADLLSKTSTTTFFVTIESLTGAAAAVGITELADDAGCGTANYPSAWIGYGGNSNCWSDYLTTYTTKPAGTTSVITSTMTVGHTYRYTLTPNTGSDAHRCGQVDITG